MPMLAYKKNGMFVLNGIPVGAIFGGTVPLTVLI